MSSERIRIELGARSYDVLIGPGVLNRAGTEIAAVSGARTAAIVTDANVAALHLAACKASVAAAGLSPHDVVVPPGESSKSYAELQAVVDALLDARLERGDVVVALGGGVVGDLAGFAAAIARRGMRLIQIPTTLLAQVDSSVGGKTGINSRHGKNLIGAFHQPELVIADTDTLDTLPRREFAAGYAEVVKYGLIGDAAFFAWLETNRASVFGGGAARDQAIATSVRAKAASVAADEFETGERALLNLGHTFAHALEAACHFDGRLVHGEAVAIGLVLAHDYSAYAGLAPKSDAVRVRTHLKEAGLPVAVTDIPGRPPTPDELMDHIAQDKKVRGGRLTFILTRGIGKAFIANDVPSDQVRVFLNSQMDAG